MGSACVVKKAPVMALNAASVLRNKAFLASPSQQKVQCPGSAAWLPHAWAEVSVRVQASCATVLAEMQARVSGQHGKWSDPHNNGTYSVLDTDDKTSLLLKRTSGKASVGGRT